MYGEAKLAFLVYLWFPKTKVHISTDRLIKKGDEMAITVLSPVDGLCAGFRCGVRGISAAVGYAV